MHEAHEDPRVILIAGASGAAGEATARRFAGQGYRLVLTGRDYDRLRALSGGLGLAEDRLLLQTGDVSTLAGANAAVQSAIEKFGRLDVLVNLVGGWTGGKSVVETALEDIDSMLRQHFYSTLHLSRAALPGMLERGWGRVVVVSSPAAGSPSVGSVAYAAGKAAQETLILAIAEEVKGSGVTANVLRVKMIDAKGEKLNAPTAKNAFWTTPEEIAETAVFLCSEAGGMVNGARLPLYGSA